MSDVAVLGAGGHAKVVADLARLAGHTVVAFVDESGRAAGTTVAGVDVVASLDERREADVALGIGDNRARRRRFLELVEAGHRVLPLVHPSAVLADGVRLGDGTVVMAGVVVNVDTAVGRGVVLNTGCSVDHDCDVQDGVHLAPGTRLAGGVVVEEGAFLGIASAVTPGRRIGAWTVCGAGSVIVHDVAPGRTVKGVPAR